MAAGLSLARRVSAPSLERSYRGRQSHPNPLGLTLSRSATYLGNRPSQTHCSYLDYFQHVSLVKGPDFSKKIVKRVPAASGGSFSLRRSYRRRQSHPNPLGLTLSRSATYLGNRPPQTHCSYLQYFQHLSLKKRPGTPRKPRWRQAADSKTQKMWSQASWNVTCFQRDVPPNWRGRDWLESVARREAAYGPSLGCLFCRLAGERGALGRGGAPAPPLVLAAANSDSIKPHGVAAKLRSLPRPQGTPRDRRRG